jgi:bifunctional enzyme CysN/CysC
MNDTQLMPATAQLKIVILGHVDHGKSTLIGRLFHDTGSLPDGKLEALKNVAEIRGTPFEWANLMDGLQSERDQNITIDTAQIWFRTERRQYVLIDAPGHKEFLKNMVTGAAGAETALLLIDAHEGIRENSRRHGYLLSLLGIRQVAVLVNKMDLVGYREGRFREIESEYRTWLESVGVQPGTFVPIAARHGDNIAKPSARMGWYGGPTVLEALDAFEVPDLPRDRPLRFPIQDVYRFDDRRILAGRVESGTVRVGDHLVFSPSAKTSTVRTIERWSAGACDVASAGECVGITLMEQVFVGRGAIAAQESAPPHEGTCLHGRIFWLGRQPLRKGKRYKLKLATAESECEVENIESVIDASTLAAVPAGAGERMVARHEVGEVTFRARKPIAFDAFGEIAATGRFVIVDGFDIAGGGIIPAGRPPTLDARADPPAEGPRIDGRITRGHRVRRNGNPGGVIWLTGPSDAVKSTIAAELERELFNMGRVAYLLDGDTIHRSLFSGLADTAREREEQMRRLGEVARLFDDAGVICIASLILPRREERDWVRRLLPKGRFVEARLNAAAYDPPPAPEIEISTEKLSVAESVLKILESLHLTQAEADLD